MHFRRPSTFGTGFNFDVWTSCHMKLFCMFLAKNDRLQIVNSLKTLSLLIYFVRWFIWPLLRVVFFKFVKFHSFRLYFLLSLMFCMRTKVNPKTDCSIFEYQTIQSIWSSTQHINVPIEWIFVFHFGKDVSYFGQFLSNLPIFFPNHF